MSENKKIYLTKEGLEDLKKEYDHLANKRRPELRERVANARNMGDLSENGEYIAAREELSFIDGRIEEIEEILKQVVLIETKGVGNGSTVKLGSTVVLSKSGKKESFKLVGEWEADPKEKKISHESPLGKALIGRQRGEKIEVAAPAGHVLYTIVDIK